MSALLMLALVLLPAGLLVALVPMSGPRGIGARLLDACAFGPPIGIGVLSVLDFFLRLAADRGPRPLELGILWGLLLLPTLFWRIATVRSARLEPESGVWRLLPIGLVLSAAMLVARVFLDMFGSVGRGVGDGWLIWNLVARSLARVEGDPSNMLAGLAPLTQSEYPQMLTAAHAQILRVAGVEAVWPGQLLGLLGFVSLGLTAQRVVVRLTSGFAANLALLMILTTPVFTFFSAYQYADVWLAALILGCFGLLAVHLRGEVSGRADLLLGGVLLGLIPWMKQEGLVLALVALAALMPFLLASSRRDRWRGDGLVLGVAVLPGFAASLLFRLLWAPPDKRLSKYDAPGFVEHILDPERWHVAVDGFLREVLTDGQLLWFNAPEHFNEAHQRWGLYWPALLLLLVCGARWRRFLRRETLFLALAILLIVGAYLLLFVTMPVRQEWNVEHAAHRLLLQIAPLLLALVLATWSESRSGEPEMEGEAGVDDAEAAGLVER